MDSSAIRARINGVGWSLKELPIVRNNPTTNQKQILQWKLIAFKGERSIEITGATLDDAMKSIGKALGVISQKEEA